MIRFLFLVLFASALPSFSQTGIINGRIFESGEPAVGVIVKLKNTSFGNATDTSGYFTITSVPYGNYTLEVRSIDITPYDTLISVNSREPMILTLHTKSHNYTQEIVVSGSMSEVSKLESVTNVEVYTAEFFKKNPTANLFESLQIVNGVRPQLNCNICNTGDIHINGLEGPYTMIMIDGMPIVSGLSTVYGLMGIPNSMIERMEIVKGPSSTLYGSEAVGGIINIITKDPVKANKLSIDYFATSQFESNLDASVKTAIGKHQSLFSMNYFRFKNKLDWNKDGFTDVTLQDRISFFNKWNFHRRENRVANTAVRYIYEDRWGGQLPWNKSFRGGDSIYGESIYTARWELMGVYELPVRKQKINFQYSLNDHHQNSAYGNKFFMASQRIAFGQLVWYKKIASHDIVSGLAFRYTYYDDNTPATANADGTNVASKTPLPGAFVQDTWSFMKNTQMLIGTRYDHHPVHGSIWTPRLGLKWSKDGVQSLRINTGSGFRVVNVFTEDHASLTGARTVVIEEKLRPEQSWNVNVNYLRYNNFKSLFVVTDLTLFYTYFNNKIIPDYNIDPNFIYYNNLDGYAVSRGITLNTEWNFHFPLKINAGVTLMDVYSMQKNSEGVLQREAQLLTEHVNGSYAVSYSFKAIGLSIDYTGNVYSPMNLPVQRNDFRSSVSPWWSIQNIQLTKDLGKNLEFYGGVKNLLNYLPPANSIMRSFDPFDKTANDPVSNPNQYTFDTSYIYAPNQMRRVFIGIRYTIR